MSIVVEKLGFAYCTRAVLTDVSFSAPDGRLLALLGPNGVGKTTLFRCILGLQRRYTGRVVIDGADARTLSPRETACRVAYIPQLHAPAYGYSVLDMVLMGASHGISPLSMPAARETRAAMDALARLGMDQMADKNVTHLSGGEQQLVYIARALAQRAKTLLLDEPTASLDYGNQANVLRVLRSLADDGYAVVLSTHNPQHALHCADDALALYQGRVEAFGGARAVIDAALIEKLYGTHVTLVETENGPLLSPAVERRRS